VPAIVGLPHRQHANQAGIVAPTAHQCAAAKQQLQQFRREHQHQRQFERW